MAYPTNYRYTREHEWIALEGKIGTVGITDYAQNSLGDIVYVDAPKVGDQVTANATFGSVESVKAVSDLYSPVSWNRDSGERGTEEPRPTRSMRLRTRHGSSRSSCRIRRSLKSCWTPRLMRSSSRKRRGASCQFWPLSVLQFQNESIEDLSGTLKRGSELRARS